MSRPPWDFDYLPVSAKLDAAAPSRSFVVATESAPDLARMRAAVGALGDVTVEALVDRAPLFWTKVTIDHAVVRDALADVLRRASPGVRWVASASRGSMALGAPLRTDGMEPCLAANDWRVRAARPAPRPAYEGFWFLGPQGVAVDREICGTGAGARLAVIDDDAAADEWLELDAEIAIGQDEPQRALFHGALMVAFAVAAKGASGRPRFVGVAPDASPRLYCIPKPNADVVSLPLAIVRAAIDGADVILCATYIEDATSPMLDDALEFATRLGRGGRGAAVVVPTGRQTSSPGESMHASLCLDYGEPASDPRVFCIAPSGRDGGWFLYPDKRGKLRPFSNRGPAVRFAAPGDDLALPFADRDRLFHAESSGASAIAAGALLLVLATSPTLTREELERVLRATARPIDAAADLARQPLADRADVLPPAVDADGHGPKTGYGRLDCARACAFAADPIAAAMILVGVDGVRCGRAQGPFSPDLGRWLVRAMLADPTLDHAARALTRHLRLLAAEPARVAHQGQGGLARQLAVLLRIAAASRAAPRRPPEVDAELRSRLEAVSWACADAGAAAALEAEVLRAAVDVLRPAGSEESPATLGTGA